jgi:23S rRNA pseudouridine1911/1915/1917 synthase
MKKLPRKNGGHGEKRGRFLVEPGVLFEDDAVVVLDKPPGLLAVPIPKSAVPSALSMLIERLKPLRQRALVVHRIDRFTSGILLFAKTEGDRQVLIRQFLAHTPVRGYLAVVRGCPKAQEGTLVHYLCREGLVQKLRTKKDPAATRAELRYVVERPLREAALLRVSLVTGLQNQIRAQFAAIGHPVIGDRKYRAAEAGETRIDRVALHAAHLEFVHPRSGERITIDSKPPADFRSLVHGLTGSTT